MYNVTIYKPSGEKFLQLEHIEEIIVRRTTNDEHFRGTGLIEQPIPLDKPLTLCGKTASYTIAPPLLGALEINTES